MNGVVIESMASLEEACDADAVIVGSGTKTREVIADPAIMSQLRQLDPSRQLIAGQCWERWCWPGWACSRPSPPARPHHQAVGRGGRHRGPESALLCAGECRDRGRLPGLALPRRLDHRPARGREAAEIALHYVAPVGQKEEYVSRALRNITPYLREGLAVG